MKKTIILSVALIFILAAAAYSQNPLSAGTGVLTTAGNFTCNLFCILSASVSAVAAIILVLSGARYMTTAEDVAERDEMKKRMIYAIAGLAIFMAAPPIVSSLTGGTIAPFNCDCIPGFNDKGSITTTTIPGLRVVIIKPKEGGEYEIAGDIDFMGKAFGGTSPYTYQWTSSVDGPLGTTEMFSRPLSRAPHIIVLEAKDAAGKNATAQVKINVIVPKPKPLQ